MIIINNNKQCECGILTIVKNWNQHYFHPWFRFIILLPRAQVVVVVAYFILSRLLYLAFSANLGLLCMPHPGMGPLV